MLVSALAGRRICLGKDTRILAIPYSLITTLVIVGFDLHGGIFSEHMLHSKLSDSILLSHSAPDGIWQLKASAQIDICIGAGVVYPSFLDFWSLALIACTGFREFFFMWLSGLIGVCEQVFLPVQCISEEAPLSALDLLGTSSILGRLYSFRCFFEYPIVKGNPGCLL